MEHKMMDAIVKPIAGEGLELRRVPVPTPGPGEVLIKVHKTAICGSDVHIYKWNEWAAAHVKPPQVIGHEYVGEIAELGAGVTGLSVGQRVSGEGHITCGRCRNCHSGNIQWCNDHMGVGVDRNGAFAEYVCIPARNVILIDENLDEEVVSFFDAYGNATHTALNYPLVGEDVLITGAGPIGVIAVGICKYAGARRVVITDMNEYRLDLARKMGADAAVNVTKEDLPSVMKSQKLSEGFDVGLEMSGSAAALKHLLKLIEEHPMDESYPVHLVFTDDVKRDEPLLAKLREQGLLTGEPLYSGVGPAIGTHVGPGACGAVYIEKV